MKRFVNTLLNVFRAELWASRPGARHGVFPAGGKHLERPRGDAEKTPLFQGGNCALFSRLAKAVLTASMAVALSWPLAGCGSLSEHMPEPYVDGVEKLENTGGETSATEEDTAHEGDAAPLAEANSFAFSGGAEEGYADPFNTEEYGQVDEPGFAAVATSPLSTLSSDVDTASYCNLRRMLQDGYATDDIPKGAVRIEEMLNYFNYDYALPEGDDLFGTTVTLGDCPWNEQTKLLVLGFATAPEAPAVDAGRNLVFLIDSSGSMDDPRKLPLLKESFEPLVKDLNENDRISIVTYSGTEEVIADGVSGDQKKAIMRAIHRIQADGCTNGQAGLSMAYELAQDNYIEGGVNRIIMASDGDLNVGMTSESDLHDYVGAMRDTGIYLSVLGFGDGNYKDTKMETLADNGNGSYHYIDCIDEAERVFSRNLSANLVPFADDVKVQVEFNPALVKGYRLIGYENREMDDEDFGNDEKDAADIGPNAQFTVCYEVILADSDFEIAAPDLRYGEPVAGSPAYGTELATATLRYRAFDDGQIHEQEIQIADEDDVSGDFYFAASVIEFGMYLRGSEFMGTTDANSIMELLSQSDSTEERDGFRDMVAYLIEDDIDDPYPHTTSVH